MPYEMPYEMSHEIRNTPSVLTLTGPPTQLSIDGQPVNDSKRRQLRRQLQNGELNEISFEAVTFVADYPNANFYRFREQELAGFAESFSGQPFLRNHDTGDIASRDGTIADAWLHERAFMQRVRLTTARGMTAFVEGQIDRFSIGWFYDGITCSCCGHDWLDWQNCSHWPGRSYRVKNEDGKEEERLCEIIFEAPHGKESSAVNAPAVHGTEISSILQRKAQHTMSEQNAQNAENARNAENAPSEQNAPRTTQDEIRTAQPETPAQDAQHNTQYATRNTQSEATDWNGYLRAQATALALQNSGLSAAAQRVVKSALDARANYTPADVEQAIADQRAVLAEVIDADVIRGINPLHAGQMHTPTDKVSGVLDWIFGLEGAQTPEPALRKLDQLYQYITGDHNWYGRFDPEHAQLANANTGTFTGLAVDSLNKIVQMHYDNQATYRWFESIVEVLPHDGSTHSIKMIMVDGLNTLPSVAEGGPYTEAKVGDSKESMAFDKRGHYIGITLEMIRKSDVARIRALPHAMVQACTRTRSGRIANLFKQASAVGPTLADDNKALFHTDHGNLASAAFGNDGWKSARKRIWEQKIPGAAAPLGLWPRFVLLPIDLYDTALIQFGYGRGDVGKPTAGAQAQEVNPYAQSRPGDPRPIPVPVPEFSDNNDWAYITDPREHAPLKMAYANAPGGMQHPMPELFQVQSETAGLMFTNDVMPVKIRDWFAYGVATYIGVGKNNVA